MQEHPKSKWLVNQLLDLLDKSNPKHLNLNHNETSVLIAIAKTVDNKTKKCKAGAARISRLTGGLSRSTIKRSTASMSKKNIITIHITLDIKGDITDNEYEIHLEKVIKTKSEMDQKSDEGSVTQTLGVVSDRHGKALLPITTKEQKQIYNVQDQNLSNIEKLCHDLHFEDFWASYPRKEKKSKARDIWVRERLDTIADEIITDIRDRQVRHDRWEDRSFIPMPTTYLNQEGWKDEIIERRKLERKSNGVATGSITQYADGIQRAKSELINKHLRAIQNNMGRKVD